jgi:hypothetical protein
VKQNFGETVRLTYSLIGVRQRYASNGTRILKSPQPNELERGIEGKMRVKVRVRVGLRVRARVRLGLGFRIRIRLCCGFG